MTTYVHGPKLLHQLYAFYSDLPLPNAVEELVKHEDDDEHEGHGGREGDPGGVRPISKPDRAAGEVGGGGWDGR